VPDTTGGGAAPSLGTCHPHPLVPPLAKKISASKALSAVDWTRDQCDSGWSTDSTRSLNSIGESRRKGPLARQAAAAVVAVRKGVDFSKLVARGRMPIHGVAACRKGGDGNPCTVAVARETGGWGRIGVRGGRLGLNRCDLWSHLSAWSLLMGGRRNLAIGSKSKGVKGCDRSR
jgi:hypothetical protein